MVEVNDRLARAREPDRLRTRFRLTQEQCVVALTVALCIVFSITIPGFGTAANLLSLLRSISILGILGLALGIVVIARGIDLSVVAIMAGSWAIALVTLQAGLPLAAVLAISLATAVGVGLINGVLVAYVETPPLFVTFALSLVIYGGVLWIAPAYVQYVPADQMGLLFLGQGSVFGIPLPVIVFAVASVLLHLLLSRTSIGLFIYAQGDNPAAARLSGVSQRPLVVFTYVASAVLSWLAGLVWIGSTGSMQMQIVQGTMIFDVVLVVVLGGISLVGGRGGVLSVVAGCALIGTLLKAFTIMNVNNDVQSIVRGAVLLAAILFDNWLHPRNEETARQGD